MAYSIYLAVRLARDAANWSDDFRRGHIDYLLGEQQPNGGFAGRQGTTDLYYTSFGLRSLALLGAIDEPVVNRAIQFLQSQLDETPSSVDLYSLIFSAVILELISGSVLLDDMQKVRLSTAVDTYRCNDGGFANSPGQSISSTYHTFLAVLAKQALGFEPNAVKPLVECVRSRRREDGGYAEIPQSQTSGTNPTAAAVVVLNELGQLDETGRDEAIRFFTAMQNEEGGFRANGRIPLADGLSTFTTLAALAAIDAISEVDLPAAANFARSLERPEGGFRGGAWDSEADVEYTFYGLGTLALTDGY